MFDFIPAALKNVFSKPATRNYPYVKRDPFEKQKGHIAIDIDNCIYCGMCGRKCPVGSIKVDRAERSWSIDRFKCIMCGACTECCPKKCLDFAGDYTMAANVKSVDTFVGKPAPEKPAPAPKENATPPQNPQKDTAPAGVGSQNA